MRNYYFVKSICPEIALDVAPEITFAQLKALYYINLSKEDYKQVRVLQFYIDLYNMRALWLSTPIDARGYYSKEELEMAMSTLVGLPYYVLDFLQLYDTNEKRIHAFPSLIASYFNDEGRKATEENPTGFLKKYLDFEREWRLVITGFRSKQQESDLALELQFEDPLDSFVAYILAQRDAKSFEPPAGFEDIKLLFDENGSSPMDLFRGLSEFRFNKIEDIKGDNSFSIDALLAYMAKLLIIEKWQETKNNSGNEIINKILHTDMSETSKK